MSEYDVGTFVQSVKDVRLSVRLFRRSATRVLPALLSWRTNRSWFLYCEAVHEAKSVRFNIRVTAHLQRDLFSFETPRAPSFRASRSGFRSATNLKDPVGFSRCRSGQIRTGPDEHHLPRLSRSPLIASSSSSSQRKRLGRCASPCASLSGCLPPRPLRSSRYIGCVFCACSIEISSNVLLLPHFSFVSSVFLYSVELAFFKFKYLKFL